MFPVDEIREDFPLLKDIVYLDNGASSLTPVQVVEKITEYYTSYRANVSRGLYRISRRATEMYEDAREKVARFINSRYEEIIFTRNTTEGINLIANSLKLDKGDKVITTIFEHHSNLLPWLRLMDRGIEVEIINPVNYQIEEEIKERIDSNTRVIAMTHVSNVLGNIFPIEKISRICRREDIYLVVDGAQSAPHLDINVERLGCDFFAFSSHKMLGPTGVGCLYVRKEILNELEPIFVGGGTVKDVYCNRYQLLGNFSRFEYGTPNISGVIGFGEAIRYLSRMKRFGFQRYEEKLKRELFVEVRNLENIEIYGADIPLRERIGILAFNIKNERPEHVARFLDKHNICVRSGHHCAIPLLRNFLRVDGCVRASLYLYNTTEEIERFITALKSI